MDARILASAADVRKALAASNGRPRDRVLLVGNAPSARELDFRSLRRRAYVAGVNRCFLEGERGVPDLYMVGDPQPFVQMLGVIRAFSWGGGVVVVNGKFFSRGATGIRRLDFPHFLYFALQDHSLRGVSYNIRQPVLAAGNIVIQCLQYLLSLGFRRIGILGADLVYGKRVTHSFGEGGRMGTRPIIVEKSLLAFETVKRGAVGGEILNCSPIHGPLDEVFDRLGLEEFLEEDMKRVEIEQLFHHVPDGVKLAKLAARHGVYDALLELLREMYSQGLDVKTYLRHQVEIVRGKKRLTFRPFAKPRAPSKTKAAAPAARKQPAETRRRAGQEVISMKRVGTSWIPVKSDGKSSRTKATAKPKPAAKPAPTATSPRGRKTKPKPKRKRPASQQDGLTRRKTATGWGPGGRKIKRVKRPGGWGLEVEK